MRTLQNCFVPAFVAILAFAGSVSAQDTEDKSSLGAQVSVIPNWEMLPVFENMFGGDTNLRGSPDITIGVVIRGRMDSGEWGVSYVRRNIDKSSRIDDLSECLNFPGSGLCLPTGRIYEFDSVHMTGIEIYKFAPFFKIKRVQVGMTFAGGIAKMSGVVTERTLTSDASGQRETVKKVTVAETLADLDVPEMFPLGRVELTVAVRIISHLRVRAGGGFNFPGISKFNVGATYLF